MVKKLVIIEYMGKTDQKIYEFLQFINQMKLVERLSLITKNGRRESDAEHTWHLVMFIWMYSYIYKKNLNIFKAIKIGLVHDIVEIISGDIYGLSLDAKIISKKDFEQKAIFDLCNKLPNEIAKEFYDLWYEYEKKESEESKYVWALDKICPRFQLAITGDDLSKGMLENKEKGIAQEEMISKISPVFKKILEKIKLDKL